MESTLRAPCTTLSPQITAFGQPSLRYLPHQEILGVPSEILLCFDHLEASPFVWLFGEMVRTAAVTWILASHYGCNELPFAFRLAGNQTAF